MLKPGLYEQVINHEIKAELDVIPENRSYTDKIDSAEASGILTSYISEVIKKGLDSISDGDSILPQIDLINKIIGMMAGETGEDYEELAVTEDARQLLALSLMNFIMRRLLHIRGFLTILSRRSCWGLLLHRNVWMVKMFWIILTDGLGFCVSVQHAKFMSEYFNSKGIPSISLEKDSSNELRRTAKKKLVSGEIKFIFVVDLYNEGVDIPEVDTILFLRPTESLTVFLQQLGRGLRLSEGKDCLTVLDFICQVMC